MPLTVNGESLASLVWNVETIADRISVTTRRGGNVETSVDGSFWHPNKPLAELGFGLKMWITDDSDAEFSGGVKGSRMRRRLDKLLRIIAQQNALAELVDTETQRRCYAEMVDSVVPVVMTDQKFMTLVIPVTVPAGCWEDVAEILSTEVSLPSNAAVTLDGFGGGTLPLAGMTVKLTPPGRDIQITASNGSFVKFVGALPAGNPTRLFLKPGAIDVKQDGNSASLISALQFNRSMPLAVPATAGDPQVTVTSTLADITAASMIQFIGRRRWLTA